MQNTDAAQPADRPRAIGTVAAVAAGLLAAAGIGAAAVGFTSTLSAPASPADPCAPISATTQSGGDGALGIGTACAGVDSLVQKKIATEVLEGRIDLTKLTVPQALALTSCAVAYAEANASAATAGGDGAAAAAAAAPAAIAATRACTEAANLTGTR